MRAERLLIGAVIALSVAVAAWASTGSTPTPGRPTTTSSTDVAVAVPLRTFASGDGAYSIDVPPGWRQLGEGPLMTFTDSTSAITIQTSTRVEPSTIDEITASVVADHAMVLDGAERVAVEVERRGAAANGQVRGDGHAGGSRCECVGHRDVSFGQLGGQAGAQVGGEVGTRGDRAVDEAQGLERIDVVVLGHRASPLGASSV